MCTILILCLCLWFILRRRRSACAVLLLHSLPHPGSGCRGKTEQEKLNEFRKMAKLFRDHTTENSINQSNSGVSLFNFQWASFASRASAFGVVALICASIILCCLWKAKAGRRRRKNQEQLLKTISTTSSPANKSSLAPASRSNVSTTAPPLLPVLIGSGLQQDGQVFPHHIIQDPVAFQGSRIPSSRHCYMTETFQGVDIPPVDRGLSCGPSQLSHTMLEPRMEHCLGSQNSETARLMTGTGDLSPPGPHVNVPLPLPVESHHQDMSLPPLFSQVQLKQRPQDTPDGESIRQGSSPPPTSARSKILPKESIRIFNDCKSDISGNVHDMKVRFYN